MKYLFLILIAGLISCRSSRNTAVLHSFKTIPLAQDTLPDSELLVKLLQKNTGIIGQVIDNKDSSRLQIIFTQINRDSLNNPSFTHHFYHVIRQYFYPASTVKLPAAVLALEKLNTLKLPGVNAHTPMITDSSYSGQSPVYNDPTSATGKPAIAQYIRKIFLVSDNDAYNRLYEFIGQESLNQRMQALGFARTQLLHRLSISLTEDQNRHTNAIRFIDTTGTSLYSQFPATSKLVYQPRQDFLGQGYMTTGKNVYTGDSLINRPMDFSKKNRVPLPYLHQLLQWVMFPATQPADNKLNLTQTDYRFLHRYMSMMPAESAYPAYDTPAYYPAYGKFLLMGGQKTAWPDTNIRIFNKIGEAYGFITDIAYIIDKKNRVEFMVSCTLLCNSDGIFNDDKYEYETIGKPFMKKLGQVLYDYEKKRKLKYKPDFSNLTFNYTN